MSTELAYEAYINGPLHDSRYADAPEENEAPEAAPEPPLCATHVIRVYPAPLGGFYRGCPVCHAGLGKCDKDGNLV